ncbi:MAG: FKBP-type peptidyl-prolyl cis-trans isomerase [Candidatus Symbiothrix sp.]|jgi:FKBP-type peptidyl-prolyl cis-trans isomerase FklB|nr:FKBP-type peptidyl-prolyl cis-trans isomerase [Candidatus Symbiothrix sp.]
MKKLVNVSLLSLVVVMGITLFSCGAKTPKASLKTDVDSLSYAFGVNLGGNQQGFGQYVATQIDSAYLKEFIRGFQEAISVNQEDKKAKAYSLGVQIGGSIAAQQIPQLSAYVFEGDSSKSINVEDLTAGVVAALTKKNLRISESEAQMLFNTLLEQVHSAALTSKYADWKQENIEYLEKNKTAEGVVTLESGLQYKVITEGTGAIPQASDHVKVKYQGTNIKGEVFDGNLASETPAEFALTGVIKGWTEGLQHMKVGSKYLFYIPENLAYGSQERSEQIKPFSTLIFEIELVDIVKPEK